MNTRLTKENSKDLEGKFIMTRYYKVHLCYELMVDKCEKSSSFGYVCKSLTNIP